MSANVVTGAKNYSVNLQGPDCDNTEGYSLRDRDDVAVVFSLPQYNTAGGRDRCEVLVTTDSSRKVQYVIETVKFNECGIDITVKDDRNTYHHFTCSSKKNAPYYGKSIGNSIRIQTRLITPESRGYEFRMKLKNDLGAAFLIEQTTLQYRSCFNERNPQWTSSICFIVAYGTEISQYGTEISQYGTEISQYDTEISLYGTEISLYGTEISQYDTEISQYVMEISQYGTEISQYGTENCRPARPPIHTNVLCDFPKPGCCSVQSTKSC
ncbi:hypothetical protein Btru_038009 [Bulinus truncatus]|nr:hypothetical protein Btru_038009 [Bulinus truncatus]